MMQNLQLGQKLTVAFLFVGVLPAAIIAIISLWSASQDLERQSFSQLESVRSIKLAQIDGYFAARRSDMGVLLNVVDTLKNEAFKKLQAIQQIKITQLQSVVDQMTAQARSLKEDPYLVQAINEFTQVIKMSKGKVKTFQWDMLAQVYDARLRGLMRDHELRDIMLLNLEGRVIYSVARNKDLGLLVSDELLVGSSLEQAYTYAKGLSPTDRDNISITDFTPYKPYGGSPAAFMMAQIYDENDFLAGFIALQIPLHKFNKIMIARDGMGETGESYIVGSDGLMRTDSLRNPANYSSEASFKNRATVNTHATRSALEGISGTQVIDGYLGNVVLSAWDPFRFGESDHWAIMSEIDVAEAFSPVDAEGVDFYKKYIEKYGYYDLFLINADGYVFYTVAKTPDYQTNMVDGPFSHSGLGRAVQKVFQTGEVVIADLSPYEPNGNQPAAFLAAPVNSDGKVQMVVAVQLNLAQINTIMHNRVGMGRTGETYLVGSDKLMRSDSTNDPEGRTVMASFAGTVAANGVDTFAVQKALAGELGSKVISDYEGRTVLSAFSPVKVGDTLWALVAELDEDEAFAAINRLRLVIGVVALVAIVLIVLAGIYMARAIVLPIRGAVEVANQISKGNLTVDIEVTRQDETGVLQESLKSMIENLQQMVRDITGSAERQTGAATQLAITTEQANIIVQQQQQSTDLVATAISQLGATVQEVTGSTSDAAMFAQEANDEVSRGSQQVSETISGIKSLASEIEEASRVLKSVKEGATDIGNILDVIKGIADQTNLLALNAAIEAARAGDQGRGFAVVADEVRSLAQSTQQSTDEIEAMISKLQSGTLSSVAAMERGRSQAEKVVAQAEVAGIALGNIEGAVLKIRDMSTLIATASEEQSVVVEDVTQHVVGIAGLAEQSGQVTREIFRASEDLAKLSTELRGMVERFEV